MPDGSGVTSTVRDYPRTVAWVAVWVTIAAVLAGGGNGEAMMAMLAFVLNL